MAKAGLFENVRCTVCNSNDYIVIHKGKISKDINPTKIFKSSGKHTNTAQVVRCKKCSMKYVTPRIRSEKIIEGYSEGEDAEFVLETKGREKTFKKQLSFVQKFYRGKKGSLLDVGTAGGTFMHVARKAGWQVFGLEPNKWLCKWGKQKYGFDITPGVLFDMRFPKNKFDVVTMWDVLEHVSDPSKELREIHRVLKEGGLLGINYPDIGSLPSKVMGKRWVFLQDVHLWYFTPRTITRILKRNGFEVLGLRRSWQYLSAGYLAHKTHNYSKTLSRILTRFLRMVSLDDITLPYWLGQTTVVARKKK